MHTPNGIPIQLALITLMVFMTLIHPFHPPFTSSQKKDQNSLTLKAVAFIAAYINLFIIRIMSVMHQTHSSVFVDFSGSIHDAFAFNWNEQHILMCRLCVFHVQHWSSITLNRFAVYLCVRHEGVQCYFRYKCVACVASNFWTLTLWTMHLHGERMVLANGRPLSPK